MKKALIVDDERDICELIGMGLMALDVECHSVYNVKSAIKILKNNIFDVVFCDVKLPDGNGIDLLAHIQKYYPSLPVCMITAHGNMEMAIKTLKMGGVDFINKPFELKELRSVCKAALAMGDEGNADNAELPKAFTHQTNLIGETHAIKRLREMITKISKSPAPLFINGESGTGKEIVARDIHRQSERAAAPFIAVNCGAIPENLVESEFFGYKKGAFTGANRDTDGLFVAANGGTLFLDEVADLPLSMQVKLLRAIQENAVRPIGGDYEEKVDVRIISATHHCLTKYVQERRFREDLYYRLNVIGIYLPPLRERRSDIKILADYLLQRLAKENNYFLATLSDEALIKLENYDFPGNVRELENILERALTFMESNVIQAADIDIDQLNLDYDSRQPSPFSFEENMLMSKEKTNSPLTDLDSYIQDIERKLLLKVLANHDGNKTKAAEMLGINFRNIRYKLKKLGIY